MNGSGFGTLQVCETTNADSSFVQLSIAAARDIYKHMSDHVITVILDTNIFIAAYWAPKSASARLIRACTDGQVQAQYTQEVRREVMYVLKTVRVSAEYMKRIELFWEKAIEVEAAYVDSIRTADPDDQKFLEAALGGGADFLVTNDDHLLSVGYVGRTEILAPASAVRILAL